MLHQRLILALVALQDGTESVQRGEDQASIAEQPEQMARDALPALNAAASLIGNGLSASDCTVLAIPPAP